MKQITQDELIELVQSVKGNTFVSFESLTVPAQRKKNNPWVIHKRSFVNAAVGFDYESNMRTQQLKRGEEPDFVAQEHAWGEREQNIIVLGDKKYLRVRVLKSNQPAQYFDENMNELTFEQVQPFLKPSTSSDVLYRNYALGNICKITMQGETYELR